MERFVWETAEEINENLAKRIRNIRRRRRISQERLSEISGVSLGSVKRFEATGNISLLSLTRISIALDLADEIRNIFTEVPYQSIEEVIHDREVGTLALTSDKRAAFEYSDLWLEDGFSVSPFSLPLEKKVYLPTAPYFHILMVLFAY